MTQKQVEKMWYLCTMYAMKLAIVLENLNDGRAEKA
jgi:hypothetical protein